MLPPIVCSCGLPIGDIARVFMKMRSDLIEEKTKNVITKNTDPNNLIYLTNITDLELTEIFKKLGINHTCCKIQINTNMIFRDFY